MVFHLVANSSGSSILNPKSYQKMSIFFVKISGWNFLWYLDERISIKSLDWNSHEILTNCSNLIDFTNVLKCHFLSKENSNIFDLFRRIYYYWYATLFQIKILKMWICNISLYCSFLSDYVIIYTYLYTCY